MNRTVQYLLDTHVFVWLMLADQQLKRKSFFETVAITGELFISPVSCWEIGLLATRNRLQLRMPTLEWVERSLKTPGLSLLALSPRSAVEASYLPGKFHGDRIDRILVATARIENLTLATRDEKILEYAKQGHVNTLVC